MGHGKGNDLVYAGKVDHGFAKRECAKDLHERLTPLVRKAADIAQEGQIAVVLAETFEAPGKLRTR